MRIVIAPDKFKESMTATEAAEIIARAVLSVLPRAELQLFPLSDGGEGLVEALAGRGKGSLKTTRVTGPAGEMVEAKWGMIDDGQTAVIEMAAASGLSLLADDKRDPSTATTYGTGELIRAALDQGCSRLIVGIGGSATNDGGAGMAQALGAKLIDRSGRELDHGAIELLRLDRIAIEGLDSRLRKVRVLVASDVDNPLTGPKGASQVYGPQKGAKPDEVERLDRALKNYARVIKKNLGLEVDSIPGAGAAGGLGAGLIAFLQAELRSGIELVLDAIKIDRALPGCDLLITGEGRLDDQSLHGKAPVGAARRAAKYKVPTIVLAGSLESDPENFHQAGIAACFAIADGPLSLSESISRGPELLERKAAELMRFYSICRK
jgi:glycerate 2-kinase